MFLPRVSAAARINLGMLVVVSALVVVAPYVPGSPPQARPAPTFCAKPLGQGWAIVTSAGPERPAPSGAHAAPSPDCH